MKKIKVLSLFDGMSCGQIALRDLGFEIETYYASEVDKFAIEQTSLNFPDTIHLGDVREIDVDFLEDVDLLIGGSPCQSFSFAGKRKGMSTKDNVEILSLDHYLGLKSQDFEFEGQSYLFWEYMRILTDLMERNPNTKFLLENVEMGKKWEKVLSDAIGIEGVHINSALVSAQNRKRIYWSNIRTEAISLFGDMATGIPQPEDRGILLKDVLQPESEVDEKYYISSSSMLSFVTNEKRLKKKYTQINGRKGPTQMARQYASWNGDYICVAQRGRNPENTGDRTAGCPTEQRLEGKTDGKTNCLTTVQKDNLILKKNYAQWDSSGKGHNSQSNRAFYENGKHGALCAVRTSDKAKVMLVPEATKQGYAEISPSECVDLENPNSKTRRGRKMSDRGSCLMSSQNSFAKYTEDFRLRRLTPTECARLQTIPSWYKWECSDTQQYKMLGNGWTVEIIKHIFKYL